MTGSIWTASSVRCVLAIGVVIATGVANAAAPEVSLVAADEPKDVLRFAERLSASSSGRVSEDALNRPTSLQRLQLTSNADEPASELSALAAVVQGTGQGYDSAMAPGTWRTLGEPVAKTCMPYAGEMDFTTAQDSCIRGLNAWTSAAYDRAGHIYWRGGGHFAYEGNEIWRFNLASGEWELASESGRAVKDTTDSKPNTYKPIYDDGTPGSAHHYAHLTWADDEQVLVMGPMLGFGDPPSKVPGVWEFDPTQRTGVRGYEKTYENTSDWQTNSIGSAYDPVTGNVLINTGAGSFVAYDPTTDKVVSQRSGFHHRSFGSSFYFAPESRIAFDWKFKGQNFYWVRYNENGVWGQPHTRWSDFRPKSLSPRSGAAERSGLIWFWDNTKEVFVLDPATLDDEKPKWVQLRNAESEAGPTYGGSSGNYGKWWYVEGQDVFVGLSHPNEPVWVYRPPETLPEKDPLKSELEDKGFTCSDRVVGWECPNLQQALKAGGQVTVPKGDYRQCVRVRKPTTLNMNGATITGVCERKATFVQNAAFTLENAECFGAKGGQGNEACIRRQKGATTVRNVHFHDSFNGIIGGTGDEVVIVDSEFGPHLGGDCSQKCGRAHGIYVKNGELTIRNSRFHAPDHQGHLVKTGAKRTVIEGSILDETGGNGSRVIDAYNGGELIIRDTAITANKTDGNGDVIGYDYEGRANITQNRIILENSEVDCAGGWLIRGRNSLSTASVQMTGNTIKACREPK